MKNILIVPAIKRIELKNVGCWEKLSMKLIPGLNIITGQSGSGKSTILRSIFRAFNPLTPMSYPLSLLVRHKEGKIYMTLASSNIELSVTRRQCLTSVLASNLLSRKKEESEGQFMLRSLRSYIKEAPPGTAILLESDVTAIMDDIYYEDAVKLLNSAKCQVICIISHQHFDPKHFRKARIFACCCDQENNKAKINLQQSGGAPFK